MTDRVPTNLEIAFDLMEFGFDVIAQRYRRAHPLAAEDEVEAHVREWLLRRPGDAPGRQIRYPKAS